MLVQNVYSVRDFKAESFGAPFFAVNDAVAKRMLAAAVSDRETPVGRNPEDFGLYRVGAWNSDSGSLAGTDVPVPVCLAVDLVKEAK